MSKPRSRDAELIATVRSVARLERRARYLRRELKRITKDLRHERRMLRALRVALINPTVIPSRLFGVGTGIAVLHSELPTCKGREGEQA